MSDRLILVLAERDYLYGTGALTLRVQHVNREDPVPYDDEPWYFVHGTQLGHEGRELRRLVVVVRGRRLASAGLQL
ncbi:hypothetical protein [Dactylosporangium sp. CS-033363]|uniref:hypothetical protein n=1 Tax=Dactylosporangium sp. CS-033363 TaxID=3239935 RepID=UPI003D8B6F36